MVMQPFQIGFLKIGDMYMSFDPSRGKSESWLIRDFSFRDVCKKLAEDGWKPTVQGPKNEFGSCDYVFVRDLP